MDALFSPLFESNLWREPFGRSIFCTESDDRAMRNLFANGEQGGYWPADPQYAYEDSAGTLAASVNGVVGLRLNAIAGYPNAVQATTGNKPYLRLTPTSNKPWYDSNTSIGALNVTFASALGSACTIATVTPEGVTILENQTVGTTYNICPPYGYNSDVLIIDRALTPAERALVTRVMQRSVPALGSELVVNGGFDDGATGWYVDPIWSISNGIASSPGGSSGYLNQGNCFSGVGAGSFIYFKADVTVSSAYFYYLGGTIGAGGSPLSASQNIRVVAYRISIDNNILFIKADSTFVGSVDNISAKVIL